MTVRGVPAWAITSARITGEHCCFACGRKLAATAGWAWTIDGQRVVIGWDCWRHAERAGRAGWQPPRGGPRLLAVLERPAGA